MCFVPLLGSTFPKAKPKQSLFTVLQLAVLRYLLLPLYAKWWIAQTSARIFAYLLFLYVMQMLNWTIYTYNVNRSYTALNDSDTCDARDRSSSSKSSPPSSSPTNEFISVTDLLVPMALSLLLSLIHSQIVATASSNLITADKHNKNQFQQHRKRRERKKRRKSRLRTSLNVLSVSDSAKSRKNTEDRSSGGEIAGDAIGSVEAFEQEDQHQQQQHQTNEVPSQSSAVTLPTLRKRNVNWRSPIKSNYTASHSSIIVHSSNNDVLEINGETITTTTTTATVAATTTTPHGVDDDGFESLNSNENGKSSSGEEMTIASNNVNGVLSAENESTGNSGGNNKQQQYANSNISNFNSAYVMGTFGDNADFGDDDDVDDDDNDLINGTNELSENVSKPLQKLRFSI